MSARKIDDSCLLGSNPRTGQCLTLSGGAVVIRKSGIEFHSEHAFTRWTEMTVSIQFPHEARKVNCSGVVVACTGNRQTGYEVSMAFTHVSPQSQARLSSLVQA